MDRTEKDNKQQKYRRLSKEPNNKAEDRYSFECRYKYSINSSGYRNKYIE